MSFNESGDILQKAKKRAAYFLGMKAYSRGELLIKLEADFPVEICEAALEWAENCGFINDREYAEKLAKKLIGTKRVGLRKARWEMKQKHIPAEIIEEVLEEYSTDDIRAEITELLKKKYSDRLDERKDIERVVGALARRGYDFDDIKSSISSFKVNIEIEYE